MQLLSISEPQHPALPFIRPLYEAAFPAHERRAWAQLLGMLSHPGMQLSVIQEAETLIGFVIAWPLQSLQYIEHLAVDPGQRGKQYGSRLLQQLIREASGNMILETEPPHDELAQRRIAFYQRAGFHTIPFPYQQPPYRAGEPPLPMQLMSLLPITDAAEFEAMALTIKTTVYEAWY
jgi:ribosomal protein S18 acetylase RimI-like enzyme